MAVTGQWVNQRTAAKLAGVTYASFGNARFRGQIDRAIEHKEAALAGLPVVGGPATQMAFLREDCLRLGEIVRRCEISLEAACRVLMALEKGGPL
jgi:hypothetical protein